MTKYIVTMEVGLRSALIEETYEVEAVNPDEAERIVLEGGGELLSDELVEYGTTTSEAVVEVKTKGE